MACTVAQCSQQNQWCTTVPATEHIPTQHRPSKRHHWEHRPQMKITDISAVYPRYTAFAPQQLAGQTMANRRTHRNRRRARRIRLRRRRFGIAPDRDGHFRELLIGANVNDTDDITKLWDTLYYESIPYGRNGIAIMALSGVDLAMWDVVAKGAIPAPSQNSSADSARRPYLSTRPDQIHRSTQRLGVAGQKLSHRYTGNDADYEAAFEAAETARNIIGESMLLMFDVYMSWGRRLDEAHDTGHSTLQRLLVRRRPNT